MTTSEIAELLDLMKERKVMHLKSGDVELTLHPDAFVDTEKEKKSTALPKMDPMQRLKYDLFDELPKPEEG